MKFKVIEDYKYGKWLTKLQEKYNIEELTEYRVTSLNRARRNNAIWVTERKSAYYNFEGIRLGLREALNDEQWFEDSKGGMIIFSTDFNVDPDASEKSIAKKIMFKTKSWFRTQFQRFFKNRIANKYLDGHFKDNPYAGWTIGNFYKGRYTSDAGKKMDEKSTTIELLGIESEELVDIATDICKTFGQETVLLKDYNKNKIFVVNGD